MTKHVGSRISAQVRSHAQKVLKDYSPKEKSLEDVGSKSEITDRQLVDHTNEARTKAAGLNFILNRELLDKLQAKNDEVDYGFGNNQMVQKRQRITSADELVVSQL